MELKEEISAQLQVSCVSTGPAQLQGSFIGDGPTQPPFHTSST